MVIRRRQVAAGLIGSTVLFAVLADAISGWFWLPAMLAGVATVAYVTLVARLRHLGVRRTIDEAFAGAGGGSAGDQFDWASVEHELRLPGSSSPDVSAVAVSGVAEGQRDLARFLALWALGWVLTPLAFAIRLVRGDRRVLAANGLAERIIGLQEYGRTQSRRLLTAGAAASIGISALGALPAGASSAPAVTGRITVSAPAVGADAATTAAAEPASGSTTASYQVRPGNTLWGIARSHGSTVTALVQANHIDHPDLIFPGQRFVIPNAADTTRAAPGTGSTATGSRRHVVRPGDTMFSLAQRFGISVAELAHANDIADPSHIYVGQVVRLPLPSRPGPSHLTVNPPAAASDAQTASSGGRTPATAVASPSTVAAASTRTTTVAPQTATPAVTAPKTAEAPVTTVLAPPTTVAPHAVAVAPAAPPAPPTTVAAPHPAPALSALPLPAQYLHGGSVDQGVDYAAPGGTPLYAMGPGKIIREGMSGFGPNAPVLQITAGPLAGKTVYYGHAGPDLVPVGATVSAGQQISIVGYGIVGFSTGPHLEVGFYPPGPNGSGQAMLAYLNGAAGHSTGG